MSTTFGNFDLYEELEIKKEATPEEIKKAYKKLAVVRWFLTYRDGIRIRTQATQARQRNSKEFPMLIQVFAN
jgi:hypothetical protein